MTTNIQKVPLQRVPGWGADFILGSHVGTTDYMLPPEQRAILPDASYSYNKNEDVWRDIISGKVNPGMEIVLNQFNLSDWFPRAPGLYHTWEAYYAREEAFHYVHYGFRDAPIRDDASMKGSKKRSPDYTVVFTPEGKSSMLQGGIGSIRLKPMNILGESHWLMTATSDSTTHSGLPIAVPRKFYGRLLSPIHQFGAVSATIRGELEFLPDPFSRLFDRAVMVPKVLIRVTDIDQYEPPGVKLENSVAVSFVSEYKGPAQVYATYVTFQPGVKGSFEKALAWMKTEYVEGEYKGKIITDFDQTRTTFPEARLALSGIMDRLISRGELRETIELMHASASVDSYFNEIERRKLLPKKGQSDRTKIFISYAHAPEERTGWVSRIKTHLDGLIKSTEFEIWTDTKITPGQRWHEKIEKAIGSTKIAILVLTADFMASDFIREAELPPLLEVADADGAKILCIYGSDVNLSGIGERLSRYQFVNTPKQSLLSIPEDARESIYVKLTRTVEMILQGEGEQ
jgi:hypothetical protein